MSKQSLEVPRNRLVSTMTEQLKIRILNGIYRRTGKKPKEVPCRTCTKPILVGMRYATKESLNKHFRHEDCAKRVNFI